ncbi:MAG TPA: hypothetical protein VFH54_07125 [Mycobacteriales bacterium]|nr:hypothetical protein [Mycobacteriales bacterium]
MSRGRHRKVQPHTGRKAAATVVFALGTAVVSTAWTTAAADAPMKYGWWSATNAGTPFTPPAPPDVPAKGLYVANSVSGPSAIAALTFNIPSGATVGALTLVATGNPVMSSPPLACEIPASGQGYTPAEGGAWSAKPAYDCKAGQVTGTAGSDGKTLTFPVAPFAKSGSLSVAIVAVGQADRIPFNAPTASALAITTSSPSVGGGAGAPIGSGVPGSGATGSGAGAAGANAPAAPAPPAAGAAVAGAAPSAGMPPAVASPQQTQAATTTGSTQGAAPAASSTPSGARINAATILGLAAMVGALLFWTEGFGVLGGRVRSLAGRRGPPDGSTYPEEPSISEPAGAAGHS